MREAQLLVGYPDSPVVGEDGTEQITAGPLPGQRAPDASGLRQDTMSAPLRFAELLRHPGFTLLLWAGDADGSAEQLLAASLSDVDELRCYVVLPAAADGCNASGIVFRDTDGQFAAAYGTARVHSVAYLIRPDGYVGYRTGDVSEKSLRGALTHVGIREG